MPITQAIAAIFFFTFFLGAVAGYVVHFLICENRAVRVKEMIRFAISYHQMALKMALKKENPPIDFSQVRNQSVTQDIIDKLEPIPSALGFSFVPETWARSFQDACAGRITAVAVLPWFRAALLAGYNRKIELANVANKVKTPARKKVAS